MTATAKTLKKYLDELQDDTEVKIYCSYNQYDIKRIVLYEGRLILEVGDSDNPIESDDYDGPMLA